MTKITVVTPVLNGERFIRRTIDSVLSQKGNFDLEYVVRDGGSTDGTLQLLAGYADNITVISQPDGSPQEAINTGMSSGSGDIGCWLNADDVLLAGALEAVVRAFDGNPAKQWLYGRCIIIDENDNEIRRPITWYKNLLGFFYSKNILLCENYINQPATFWRMSLWKRCGELNWQYKGAWDYELWLRMARISPAIHLRRPLSCFRRHEDSISERHFLQQFNEELDIAKKYGNKAHSLIHALNYYKIVSTYWALNWLQRRSTR